MSKIYFVSDCNSLQPAQPADTMPNYFAIWLSPDTSFLDLASAKGCENAGEAHFILEFEVNGKITAMPITFGLPAKDWTSYGYPAWVRENNFTQEMGQSLCEAIINPSLSEQQRKAAEAAYKGIGSNENNFFLYFLQENLQQSGYNKIAIRWYARDLSQTAAPVAATLIAENHIEYGTDTSPKAIATPEQIVALDAEAMACLAAEKFDDARAIYTRILDGLGEEKYDSQHISYRDKYARANQIEKELNWQIERDAATEAQRIQAEQFAIERTEKEAAERQHVLDNLYQHPREEDLGITSDLHQKCLNKIVFSKKAISTASTEADLCDSFTLYDTIYAKAFLPKSLHNYFNDIGYEYSRRDVFLTYKVAEYDKNTMPFWEDTSEIAANQHGNTALNICISPASSEFEVKSNARFDTTDAAPAYINYIKKMLYNLYFLPVGTHQIELHFYIDVPADEHDRGYHTRRWRTQFGDRFELGKGTFTLVVDTEGKKALGERIATHQPPIVSYFPEVETEMLRLLSTYRLSDRFEYKILKIATASDWTYEREGILNLIIARVMPCDIYVQYSNGYLAIYSSTFRQEHLGSNNFSALRIFSSRFYDLISNESKF